MQPFDSDRKKNNSGIKSRPEILDQFYIFQCKTDKRYREVNRDLRPLIHFPKGMPAVSKKLSGIYVKVLK